MYEKINLEAGTPVYFNKYTGYVEAIAPLIKGLPTGGILADEMGLGKTVEVLACILSNPRSLPEAMEIEMFDKESKNRPVVECQPKRRKVEKSAEEKSKKREVEEEVKPAPSKRGVDRKALQKWYQVMLEGVSVRKRKIVEETEAVQCICGNFDMKAVVSCTFCQKQQHSACLGYNKSLGVYICPQCWMEQVKHSLIKEFPNLINTKKKLAPTRNRSNIDSMPNNVTKTMAR